MKPLFISTLYAPNVVGGAEKIAQIVAESMRDAGHTPVVISASEAPGVTSAEVNGVRVYYVGLRNLYWPYGKAGEQKNPLKRALWHAVDRQNPWMAGAVARILEQERPDVVNTHALTGFSSAVWSVAKRRGLKVVHTLHEYALMCPRASMFRNDQNCASQCFGCRTLASPSLRASQLADAVIGVSRFTLDRHLRAGYFARTPVRRVIYNGLPGEPAPAGTGFSGERRIRLGFVGRLVPPKGIEALLAAVRDLGDSCSLVVAGRGAADYENHLKTTYAAPSIRFLGFVDSASVYRDLDMLVVPSLWEDPLPTIVMEAYFHGVPVIASARGGLPELVEHGVSGLIYDPDDPDALRSTLRRVAQDPELARQLRPAALRRAELYRVSRMQAAYRELLEGMAKGRA